MLGGFIAWSWETSRCVPLTLSLLGLAAGIAAIVLEVT